MFVYVCQEPYFKHPNGQTLYIQTLNLSNLAKQFLPKIKNNFVISGKMFEYRNKVLKNSKNSVWILFIVFGYYLCLLYGECG